VAAAEAAAATAAGCGGASGEAWLVGACLEGESETAILQLLIEGATHLLPLVDARELFEAQHPFSPLELDSLAKLLNAVAHRLLWAEPGRQRALPHLAPAATRLLALLVECDARRPFRPRAADGSSAWLLPIPGSRESGE